MPYPAKKPAKKPSKDKKKKKKGIILPKKRKPLTSRKKL